MDCLPSIVYDGRWSEPECFVAYVATESVVPQVDISRTRILTPDATSICQAVRKSLRSVQMNTHFAGDAYRLKPSYDKAQIEHRVDKS
jgi:hypothetical protein